MFNVNVFSEKQPSVVKCIHFCDKLFFESLMKSGVIYADSRGVNPSKEQCKRSPYLHAYKYVFGEKRLNEGNGMFFFWDFFDKNIEGHGCSKGDYVKLVLEIPSEEVVKTNYEDWRSFSVDLWEHDGDINSLLDFYDNEPWCSNGIDQAYENIFKDLEGERLQYLSKKIDASWIICAGKSNKKVV